MPFNRPIPDRTPGNAPRSKFSGGINAWVQAEKYIQIALVLPSGALIGWLIGAWLGSRFHQPWIVAVGVVVGIVAGLSAAVRMALVFTSGAQAGKPDGSGAEKDGSGKQP